MAEAESRSGGLKRALGALDLTLLGIGAIVGAGIFVLTGVAAARYAGPAIVLSFVVSGFACAMAALCYAEFAAMIPVAGSAYSYSYATMGELVGWIIGWDLVLEYAVAAAAVAVGWSGYLTVILHGVGIHLPIAITNAPGSVPGAIINLPALLIVMLVTWVLYIGISESARINSIIVAVKLFVIGAVIVVGAFFVRPENWSPFAPMGWTGVMKGAAVIFFAYIGFDAVSTAAEEVVDPKRDLPLGILGSLFVCTVLYILVAAVLTGMVPAHLIDVNAPLASAFVLRGMHALSGFISLGAVAGLTSVLLVMMLGQSRVFFAVSRDGLLPPAFSTDSSEVSHAVHTDHADRNRSRNRGGAAADPGNRGADEYRDAVRVRAGMLRRVDSAPRRAGLEAPVPHAAGAVGADFRRRLLPLPDGESAAGYVDSFFRVDGDRAGHLLQLRPLP